LIGFLLFLIQRKRKEKAKAMLETKKGHKILIKITSDSLEDITVAIASLKFVFDQVSVESVKPNPNPEPGWRAYIYANIRGAS
jgi:hypothetical protein